MYQLLPSKRRLVSVREYLWYTLYMDVCLFSRCFIPMAEQMQKEELDDYVERVKICEPLDNE